MPFSKEFNLRTAQFLAAVSALTYIQYANGKPPQNNGKITPPVGYRQIASFTAPEPSFETNTPTLPGGINPLEWLQDDFETQKEAAKTYIDRVYFGFALEAADSSGNCVIALRGTKNPYEWFINAKFEQIAHISFLARDSFANPVLVHSGFFILFAFLKHQIMTTFEQFTNPQTIYVTGHSLGAALAVHAALALGNEGLKGGGSTGQIQMYNYAGPRVGNPAFVTVYNSLIPYSYRIVNQADVVPIVPPRQIKNFKYGDVGSIRPFLAQTGDIVANHSLEEAYLPALYNKQNKWM
jgi:triacylglycerol lipase